MEFFAKNIKYLREQKGLNQAEMLDFIGFKQSTWGGYETGKSYPSLSDFLKISKAFGVSETELLHKDLEKYPKMEHNGRVDDIKKHCQFESICELKKSDMFFSNTNSLIKNLEEIRVYQFKYIVLLESYNTMTILFAKAHMKLMHLYYS
jgi:transcriptional regulator with XRE-family HTH domain